MLTRELREQLFEQCENALPQDLDELKEWLFSITGEPMETLDKLDKDELINQWVEYFNPLDIEYIVGYNKTIREIVVTTATGGPHIEIHLAKGVVKGYHGGETVVIFLNDFQKELTNTLWEFYEEIFHSG